LEWEGEERELVEAWADPGDAGPKEEEELRLLFPLPLPFPKKAGEGW